MEAKLEIVKQVQKDNVLASEPSGLGISSVPCSWVNEKGERPGEVCGRKAFDGNIYCTAHSNVNEKRKVKEEKSFLPAIERMSGGVLSREIPLLSAPVMNKAEPRVANDANIDEILTIMKNFSIAMVNLTELLKSR